mmetsp:Transcript_17053/g.50106  ORF Transcript_17053/g.50106 Transcript_17053/m.50106 type:complete len:234 (+) Transcript_17053:410-1111(+)
MKRSSRARSDGCVIISHIRSHSSLPSKPAMPRKRKTPSRQPCGITAMAGRANTEQSTAVDCIRLDQRVSTTEWKVSLCPLPEARSCSSTVARARVCSGAWGMSPFPGGTPKRPTSSTSRPRTEKSQWYALGFCKWNFGSCASLDETLWSKKKSAVSMSAGKMEAAICHASSTSGSSSAAAVALLADSTMSSAAGSSAPAERSTGQLRSKEGLRPLSSGTSSRLSPIASSTTGI